MQLAMMWQSFSGSGAVVEFGGGAKPALMVWAPLSRTRVLGWRVSFGGCLAFAPDLRAIFDRRLIVMIVRNEVWDVVEG